VKELEQQSERQLRKTVRACERTLERLASLDVEKAIREGRTEALLAEGERAVAASLAAKEELRQRGIHASTARSGLPDSLRGILPTRTRVPHGAHPAAVALRAVAAFGHRELAGATLTASRLTHDEGVELAALVKRLRAPGDGRGFTSEERARYEFLLGKCAGNESLFAKHRRETTTRKKLDELTKEARIASLPRHVAYEEPGAVVLPAIVFEWLTTSREASWTIADVGVLAAVLGVFANRDASLIVGAQLERDGDHDVLVIPEDVRFRHDANPHPMQGGAGQVNPSIALATLARNKWIVVERDTGAFRIRLGQRGRAVRCFAALDVPAPEHEREWQERRQRHIRHECE
jgi:hypothetical protein